MDNKNYYCKKHQQIKQYSKYYYLKNKDRIDLSNQSIQELKEYYWEMYMAEPKVNNKINVVDKVNAGDEIICNFD
jgi:hypothetical protein